MIVTVEKGLGYVKQYLESSGKYEVYFEDEYVGPMDALIYEQERDPAYFESLQEELRVQNLISDHEEHGLILISAKHKSPKEIEAILHSRIVERIF